MLTNMIQRPPQTLRPAPEPGRPIPDSDHSVGKIEAVCSRHAIPCGVPDSLERFVRALHDDKHLAMEFWSLVARLPDQDPTHLLATIVQGVTCDSLEDVTASSTAQRLLVREIAGMLAGEDVQTPLPPRPVQSARPSDRSGHIGPSRRDAIPRRGAAPPQSTPRSTTDTTERPRLVLRSETPFAAAMDRNLREREPDLNPPKPDPELEIAIPLATYAEENADGASAFRKLAGGILLVLAATGALLYHSNWRQFSTSIHAQYAAALARRDHFAAPIAASINANQANFSVSPSAVPTSSQPVAAPANANPPQPAAAPENPNPPHPVAPHNASPAAPRAESRADDTANPRPHAEASLAVPESEMRRNLASSRVPIFPAGTSGSVVIQAIVTARGTVEPVRVVSGNPALARAAMAAAATWHYRPYLQNGVPVNVSTNISVDSAGNN